MSDVGGFFHKAAKGVGFDSGPRPGGTRVKAAIKAAELSSAAMWRRNVAAEAGAKREAAATKIQAVFRGHKLRSDSESHQRLGAIKGAEAFAASSKRRVTAEQLKAELGTGGYDTTYYGKKGEESTHIRAMLNDPRLQQDYMLNRPTDHMGFFEKNAALGWQGVANGAHSATQAIGLAGADAGQNVQARFESQQKYKNESTLHWAGRKVYEGVSSVGGRLVPYLPLVRTASSGAAAMNEHSKVNQFDQLSKGSDDTSDFTRAIAAGAMKGAQRARSNAVFSTVKNIAKDVSAGLTLGISEGASQAETAFDFVKNASVGGELVLGGARMLTDRSAEARRLADVDLGSPTEDIDKANKHLLALQTRDHAVSHALIKHMDINISGPSDMGSADASRIKRLMVDPSKPETADAAFRAMVAPSKPDGSGTTDHNKLQSRRGLMAEMHLNNDLQRVTDKNLKPSQVSRMANLEWHRVAQVRNMQGGAKSLAEVQQQTVSKLVSRTAKSLISSPHAKANNTGHNEKIDHLRVKKAAQLAQRLTQTLR